MRASIGGAAVLLGALGIVTGAAGVPGKQFEATCNLENKSVPFLITAQVAGQSTSRMQDTNTITFCRDTESLSPDSAFNSFSPVSTEFLRQIGAPHGRTIEDMKQYRVTLVTSPKHGVAQLVHEPSQHWTYKPVEGYTGADRAIYLVETQGKQYKVVVNFWVVEVIDESLKSSECNSGAWGQVLH